MDPLPYNITISSQTATISYLPARDGDSAAGWNLTYSQGTRDTGYGHPQGVGTDVRWTTLDGATMQLSWVGTAVYLYGQAFSASYTVDVDGDRSSFSSANVPQGGLLGSKTGLSYGNHTATLTTHGTGEVSLQFAQLTVGVGYPGSSVQNRTVLAVDSGSSNPIPNTFFTYQGIPGGTSWHIEDAKSQLSPSGVSVPVPLQMVTSTVGESVSFTLEQTTAFFLYGSMNFDHGQKLATLTPHSDPSKARTTVLNDYSSALDFFQIIYWEAGLDRNEHYSVQITQVGQAPGNIQPSFGFHSLLIMDGGSPSNATDPGSGTNPGSNPLVQPDSSKLSTGAIVGIVIAGVIVFLLFDIGAFLLWRRRNRHNDLLAAHDRNPDILGRSPSAWVASASRDTLLQAPGASSAPATPGTIHRMTPTFMSSTSQVQVNAPFSNHATNGSISTFTPQREVDAGPLPPEYQGGWVHVNRGSLDGASAMVVPGTNEKGRRLVLLTYNGGEDSPEAGTARAV